MAEFDSLLDLEFDGVKMPCSKFSFAGGHDSAEHKAHLRDGALYEPTGRRPYTGSCVCPLVNSPELVRAYGPLYPVLSERIRGKLQALPIARMVHPILGLLTVFVESWQFEAHAESRNGVELTFEWKEHNDSVGIVIDEDEVTAEGVRAQSQIADDAVSAVSPSTPATSPAIGAGLSVVANGNARASELRSTYREMSSAIDTASAANALATSSAASAMLELERLRSKVLSLQRATIASDATTRRFTLSRTMALFEVSIEVYGTVSTAAMVQLQSANSIASPLAIAAGTVLKVPELIT